MKTNLLVFAAIAAISSSSFSVGAAENGRPLRLADIVAHMESTYRGEVTAIQLDTSDNKPAHYHVDMRFPAGGVAKFDIDALTRAATVHDTRPSMSGFATIPEVATLVTKQLPGQLTLIEFDAGSAVAPHYDVDVRIPGGIARLKVDAATRTIAWRQPAVIEQ
ncbi:MAG TPA: hypothetical protein VLN59_00270 [Burkholderiales bacterium]|nr:hypothetical protein [Burkholderiales bacterium]